MCCKLKTFVRLVNGYNIIYNLLVAVVLGSLTVLLSTIRGPCACYLAVVPDVSLNHSSYEGIEKNYMRFDVQQREEYRHECEAWLNHIANRDKEKRMDEMYDLGKYAPEVNVGLEHVESPLLPPKRRPIVMTTSTEMPHFTISKMIFVNRLCVLSQNAWVFGWFVLLPIFAIFATVLSCIGSWNENQWGWQTPAICATAIALILSAVLLWHTASVLRDWLYTLLALYIPVHLVAYLLVLLGFARWAYNTAREEYRLLPIQPTQADVTDGPSHRSNSSHRATTHRERAPHPSKRSARSSGRSSAQSDGRIKRRPSRHSRKALSSRRSNRS
ncbi:unnamed protein product, partial [Mesorhabditis spiculigera]